MRVLWIKANKLLPVDSGGDIRSFQIARQLNPWHQMTFLSYYDGPRDIAYEQQLSSCFASTICIATGKSLNPLLQALDYVHRLPRKAAYAVTRFECLSVRETIKSQLQEKNFDVAVCDFLDAAVNFPEEIGIPAVLFQHNVESEIWRRHATTEHNPAIRLLYQLEFRKMLRYESDTVRKFHHVIAVSNHDRELMGAWVDPTRISVVPTGVDLRQFRRGSTQKTSSPLVMFVGAMDWEPNIDAVEYFCDKIWPAVLHKVPEARFRIVGRNPDRRVQKLVSNSVEVTGRVDSVVEQLWQAAVVVVPLRVGGGTRLKIYEAMAAGKAIVSTSVGAEGLDVHHGNDIILADTPEVFSRALTTFLLDTALRGRIERAAADLVTRHDWTSAARKFAEVLQKVAETGPGRMLMSPAGNDLQASV